MISKIFEILASVFDAIPILNKIKGGRSIIGLLGLAIVAGLQAYGIGNPQILADVHTGLLAFTGLALLAHDSTSHG